jgi:uncharacterized protein GlcG (DUF336 family)
MPRQITTITLADARQIIEAGEKKAQEPGIPYNIAVVDAGGCLISHVRMDGAWSGSIDISISKAWTSRAFDMPPDKISELSQSGQSLFGLKTTNRGKVVIFGGRARSKWVMKLSGRSVRAAEALRMTSKSFRQRPMDTVRTPDWSRLSSPRGELKYIFE